MKRFIQYFLPAVLLLFSSVHYSFSQDDVYYDPNKDNSNQNTYQTYDTVEATPVDRTDGYSTENPSAYNYDAPNNSETYSEGGNTYVTNNYYYDDDDTYIYTNRLRRYYAPNWGVNYYSYWFTPTFYYGWNNWNSGFAISYSPWYNDPWWGWNNCNYYSSWYDPYWGGNYCRNNGWGWNNGGFGGGYCGYGGYNNGYNNGYWNGYNNGYYDGWNSSYGYGNYDPYYNYQGPRRRSSMDGQTSNGSTVGSPGRSGANVIATNGKNITERDVEIPREGIQKPITTSKPVQNNTPVKTTRTEEKLITPYNENGKVAVGKPQETPRTVQPNTGTTPQVRPNTTVPGYVEQKPADTKSDLKPAVKQPAAQPQPRNDLNTPPVNDNNTNERREAPVRYRPQPQPQQPAQQNEENRYNRNTYRPRTEPQPQPQQQKPERVAPQNNYQQRNVEQPRPIQPRVNPAPQQQNMQPRSNPQPQMQQRNFEQPRNIQPAPQQPRSISPGGSAPGGGGMRRRF